MEQRGAALRVGFFVLAGIVVLIGMIFVLSSSLFRPGVKYESYFSESVQGLDVGSSVKFRGVTIGKVSEIALVSADYPPSNSADLLKTVYHQVVVQYRVDPRKLGPDADIKEAIAHGLRVQVAPQGITGLAYLELSFVDPKVNPVKPVPWTPRNLEIPSVPSTLTQVQDALQSFLTNIKHVQLDKTIKTLTSMVAVVNQELTTGDAHQALANANGLLGTLRTQVSQADLPATTAAVRNLADGKQTRDILTKLDRTTDQLARITAAMPRLIAQTQATIGSANRTTAILNRQMVPILHNLNAATANLNELTETLKSNPASVLRGSPPPPPERRR